MLIELVDALRCTSDHEEGSLVAVVGERADAGDQGVAVFVRHADVADEDVEPLALQAFDGLVRGPGCTGNGLALLKHAFEERAGIRLSSLSVSQSEGPRLEVTGSGPPKSSL